MSIPVSPHKPISLLACTSCKWEGTTADLNGIEGYCCPKCGEPLFPPEWVLQPPESHECDKEGR